MELEDEDWIDEGDGWGLGQDDDDDDEDKEEEEARSVSICFPQFLYSFKRLKDWFSARYRSL
jgi:hypothetical protein